MRKTHLCLVFLAATASVACSVGDDSDKVVTSSPPPPQAPPPRPSSSAFPPDPPFPSMPAPSFGTLTCNPCKKIAFVSTRDGNDEIYSVNADGTELTRLTNDPSADLAPAWSPDGQRIAFTSDRNVGDSGPASSGNSLYVMDADGSNVRRLTFSVGVVINPDWSPDGNRITYGSESDGSMNLWQIPATGGTAELLFSSPGFDSSPAWSPDGTRLALVSDWLAYDFVLDVFLINSDGSGFTTLTDGIIFDYVNYYSPSWSPSGDRIALIVHRDYTDYGEEINWLGVMRADGSGLTLLLTPRLSASSVRQFPVEYFYDPSWSSDGTTIAYTHSTGQTDVGWVKADGSARGTIVTNGRDPDWQP